MTYATLEARRDARDAVSHPGKFEGQNPMVPILDAISLDGGEDDYANLCGDSYVNYYSRIGKWIVHTDDAGFVSGTRFDTLNDATSEIERLRAEIPADDDGI